MKPQSSLDTEKPKLFSGLHLLILFFLAVITAFVYSKSLHSDFVKYDDPSLLYENRQVPNFSLKEIFSSKVAEDYVPLVITSYAVENSLFGLTPFYYHLDNLILHILNVILVFTFIYLLSSRQTFVAAFCAVLFALHPLHVESVAWVAERKDVLSTFFFVLSLIFFWRFLEPGRDRFKANYFASWVFFVLAIFSKYMAVTLPIFLLFFYWQKRKSIKETLVWLAPFFLVSIVFTVIHMMLHNQGTHVKPSSTAILDALKRGADSLAFYITKSFMPSHLSAFYERGVVTASWFEYGFSAAVITLFAVICKRVVRLRQDVAFGWLFLLITLLPVLQIIPFGNNFAFADRFMYLPSIGIFYAIAVMWAGLLENRTKTIKWVSRATFASIFVFCSYASFERTEVWRNSTALWADAVQKYPKSAVAHNNLGSIYLDHGQNDTALSELKKAIELNPDYSDPHINLGISYMDKNNYEEAKNEFETAIHLNPVAVMAYFNLGLIAEKSENLDLAFDLYKRSMELDPSFSFARHNLGVIYVKKHKLDEALAVFRELSHLDPSMAEAHHNMGMIYLEKQDVDAALKEFTSATQADALFLEPHVQMARIYDAQKRTDLVAKELEAIQRIQNLIKNQPPQRSRRAN